MTTEFTYQPPVLEPGDHLDQPTFHARYELMPETIKAELINGVVFEAVLPDVEGRYCSVVFPGLWLDGPALLALDGKKLIATLQLGIETREHAQFVSQLADECSRRPNVEG
ncbi:MAG: hypothetical protein R3E01_20195 [Pirellulaceae bacterium]|nr:hypothetical protein [Planctomycetales bacterium]